MQVRENTQQIDRRDQLFVLLKGVTFVPLKCCLLLKQPLPNAMLKGLLPNTMLKEPLPNVTSKELSPNAKLKELLPLKVTLPGVMPKGPLPVVVMVNS